jgi:hypothetical protein
MYRTDLDLLIIDIEKLISKEDESLHILNEYIKEKRFCLLEEAVPTILNKSLKRKLIELLEIKDNPIIMEIWDDFLVGHCHEFAISLVKLFGYKLGLIKGESIDPFGKELKHLFHAFAIDSEGNGFDIEGSYDFETALKGYESMPSPITGNVASSVELVMVNDIESFSNEIIDGVEIDPSFVIKGINRIVKDPLKFFKTKKMTDVMCDTVITNEKWKLQGDNFYEYKQDLKRKINISFKNSKNVGIWNPCDIHFTWKGIMLNLGLGTYSFDLITRELILDNKIEDISDEQSLCNIIEYIESLSKDINSGIFSKDLDDI